VERALNYETQRQFDAWLKTGQEMGQVPKQTRGWDDAAGVTVPQREKEESSDYRYFPDPDLVPLHIAPEQLQGFGQGNGQRLEGLPAALRRELEIEHGLKPYDADVIVSQGRGVVEYFQAAVAGGGVAKRVSSWIQQDVLRTLNETGGSIESFPVGAARLAELLQAIESGELDNTRGKDVFQYWLTQGVSELSAAKTALGIATVDRGELEALCRELLDENPKVVEQVREGNLKGLGSLIGAAKKKNPNADPKLVRELCQQLIESL
ncbi:MAG: Asp-tRNA(Asn)/Glu-tRNA(Gln) amidotransferase GatCAB subunit B, partial [Planctomycetales bacterium]|nr:Asp-tRNA(Asn)/Glu-tRNA(Gln) amidotransferase GatCAB subunit B [Planctomycetales bacterium]